MEKSRHTFSFVTNPLEAEDLVLELADRTRLGESKSLGALLHGADHGRGTAKEDLDIGSGGGEALLNKTLISTEVAQPGTACKTYLDHVGGDKADTACPALGRVVENVVDAESVILLLQLLELIAEQDVLGVDVGEDQVDLGGVVATVAGTVADDGLDNLQHGGDTSATGDHTDVAAHVGGVDHGTLRAADLQLVADLQSGEVLGDVTLGVSLDEQIEVASLVVGGNGSVRADNLLGLAVNGSGKRDVLTDREAEDIGGTGEGETVDGDIVRDLVLLLEDEVLELSGI
jgi:hypothetical protein